MPWSGPQFQGRHNHSLSPAQSVHAAHIANAILRRGVPEGEAIATANKLVGRAPGGMIGYDAGGMTAASPTPGLQPSNATVQPNIQGLMQRFQSMTPEQLRELLPRLSGSPIATIAQRVLQQKQMMPQAATPQQQPTPAMAQFGVPASVQPGSVQPQQMAQAAPYAAGGGMQGRDDHHDGLKSRDDSVAILAAGGEFVIAPHHVARWGGGDLKEGHKILDKFVVDARKHIIETMRGLKPPVKS